MNRRARFDALYDAHADALLRYGVRRVDRPEDGADILAETMLIAWRRLDDVPTGPEARYWLLGVARRVLANHRRSAARHRRLAERVRHHLRHAAPVNPMEQIELAHVVEAAMDQPSEDDRELLRLSAWEGLGPNEIALVWRLPATTVRSRLFRARARLRAQLEVPVEEEQQNRARRHWGDDDDVLMWDPEGER
jgi:RNA polymerase sigma-70 factor (ECF subfamily)